jgi:accessory colonization factor AcfC
VPALTVEPARLELTFSQGVIAMFKCESIRYASQVLSLSAFLGLLLPAAAGADNVLRLYGPPGPSPAISEAATAFEASTGVRVEVKVGPVDEWLSSAEQDADIVYATADYLMSRFLRLEKLQVDAVTVRPLFMQASAVLVRPSNPKNILDFPDLLKPNVNVMVVTGTGQTDIWEDMAGKLEDIRMLRMLRKNVVEIAETGEGAMKIWQEKKDIDAWITWNVWFMPRRDQATLVPVTKDYGVNRRCSIALTQRGRTKPAALEFLDFLTSKSGVKIFESWGWVVRDPSPLTVNTDICIVARIDKDEWREEFGAGLLDVWNLMKEYEEVGIPLNEVHLSAVVEGDPAYWLLNDAAYRAVRKDERANPNKAAIEALLRMGVSVELCEKSMKAFGFERTDLLPDIKVVPTANLRVIDLEQQGYAQVRLNENPPKLTKRQGATHGVQ